jgi:hypothetical protein
MRKQRHHPDAAVMTLDEVSPTERSPGAQLEHVSFYEWPHRFHEIEREARSSRRVEMEQPDGRIKAYGTDRKNGLDLYKAVQVVEEPAPLVTL